MLLAPLILSLGLGALDAEPGAYVDRIAAVVGDRVVLLSEVRARAVLVARSQKMQPAQLTEAVMHEIAERLVDDRLILTEAEHMKVTIEADEVDHAIEQLAQANNVSVANFLKDAEKQGVPAPDLRDALRRQLIESKLLVMRSSQMQRIEEKDLRARYELLKKQVKDPKDLKSYDDLKNELLNQLLQERIQQLREDWVGQLRSRAYIEVRVGNPS